MIITTLLRRALVAMEMSLETIDSKKELLLSDDGKKSKLIVERTAEVARLKKIETLASELEEESQLATLIESSKIKIAEIENLIKEIDSAKTKAIGEYGSLLKELETSRNIFSAESSRIVNEVDKAIEIAKEKLTEDTVSEAENTAVSEPEPENVETETSTEEVEVNSEVSPTEYKPADNLKLKEIHPIEALMLLMKKFDDKYKKEKGIEDIVEVKAYDKSSRRIWENIPIAEDERAGINEIIADPEYRKVAYAIPTELLKALGRDDFITVRNAETDIYIPGFLNNWRPKFTYSKIQVLWQIISAESSDSYKTIELVAFFDANTDKPSKNLLGRVKYEAFPLV